MKNRSNLVFRQNGLSDWQTTDYNADQTRLGIAIPNFGIPDELSNPMILGFVASNPGIYGIEKLSV